MSFASYAYAPGALADPPGSSALLSAVAWLQGTLLGSVASAIAIIAVAWVGFMMLSGRIDVRHGATVILGCFILFGASTIVRGIQSSLPGPDARAVSYSPEPPPLVVPASPPRTAADDDPYAGASVPRQR